MSRADRLLEADKALKTKFLQTTFDKPMTRKQAEAWGNKHIDPSLKRAGFKVTVMETDPEIHGWHGWHGYRINIGKRC